MSVNPQGIGAALPTTVIHSSMKTMIAWAFAHGLLAEAMLAPIDSSARSHFGDLTLRDTLFEAEDGLFAPDEDLGSVGDAEDHDVSSFFGMFTQLHTKSHAAATIDAPSAMPGDVLEQAMPEIPEDEAGWEGLFAWGMYYSAQALQATESSCSWTRDQHGSEGSVPAQMRHAEKLLAAARKAPASLRKEKISQQALRIYYHAKWLAERNYAQAAEYRYRMVEELAVEGRRTVLAAHALSRLGYFLMHWNRREEARQVFRRSEQLTTKSNPLAPFLLGVLDRGVAGADLKQLLEAEARILNAAAQPSVELQLQRSHLVEEIQFWRAAEGSPKHCWPAPAVPHFFICLLAHLVDGVWKATMFAE